jgi:hypothetical protein
MENTIRQRFEQNIKLVNEDLNKDTDPAIPIRVDPERLNLYTGLAEMSDELVSIKKMLFEIHNAIVAK